MKLATKVNLFNHTNLIRVEHINHIAEQDWTADELSEFVFFLNSIAGEYRTLCPTLDEKFKHFEYLLDRWDALMEALPVEEIEDKSNTWLDDRWFSVKIAAEDIAAELVLEGPHYFSNAYSE